MIIEIKIPSPGESINEVEIATWFVKEGDLVEKDQEIAELESEKATLALIAEESGKIQELSPEGEALEVGSTACKIDTSFKVDKKEKTTPESGIQKEEPSNQNVSPEQEKQKSPEIPASKNETPNDYAAVKVSPVAANMMKDLNLNIEDIISGLRKISKTDVERVSKGISLATPGIQETGGISREKEVKKMSVLRRKLSQRLVAVKNETAMLTTFNEVDMSEVIRLRKTWQSRFVETHGIKLGFMSFFTKAASLALKERPGVNSMMDGDNLISFHYSDIGIAVQTEKGLMVPVIRSAETLSLADIEKEIIKLAEKARKNRISIEDMSGGTFTITNGGVFGSMLSTPILNPPQSAILGMHNIVERPVAVNGKVEIRPIMYLALSYDHRVIDGRDSVGFLVRIKELIESPVQMLGEGKSLESLLFEI